MRLRRLLAATAVGAALVMPAGALADPKHCPPGLAKKGWCSPARSAAPYYRDRERYRERHREGYRERYRERHRERDDDAYQRGYLDGLADGWRRGERIPHTSYRIVENYYDYGWRDPEPDQRYVMIDGKYYLIQVATGLVLDLLLR